MLPRISQLKIAFSLARWLTVNLNFFQQTIFIGKLCTLLESLPKINCKRLKFYHWMRVCKNFGMGGLKMQVKFSSLTSNDKGQVFICTTLGNSFKVLHLP